MVYTPSEVINCTWMGYWLTYVQVAPFLVQFLPKWPWVNFDPKEQMVAWP